RGITWARSGTSPASVGHFAHRVETSSHLKHFTSPNLGNYFLSPYTAEDYGYKCGNRVAARVLARRTITRERCNAPRRTWWPKRTEGLHRWTETSSARLQA